MTTTKDTGSVNPLARELTDGELDLITGADAAKGGSASTKGNEPFHPRIPLIAILIG